MEKKEQEIVFHSRSPFEEKIVQKIREKGITEDQMLANLDELKKRLSGKEDGKA